MKSLQNELKRIRDTLNSTSAKGRVFHYTRPANIKPSWIVWQEDGEYQSFDNDNRKDIQQVQGIIDCYTQKEYDPLLDEVQDALNASGIGWRLSFTDYEDDTKLIHYQWEFYLA